jgi:polyisoprenoid-binding protein YceI
MSITNLNGANDAAIAGSWQLDPSRSRVEFRVEAMWGLATVKGHFDDYQGELDLSADPAIELTINAASLQTGNRRRDKHLRSPDFFEVEQHPRLRFRSDSVSPDGDTLKIRGRLTARGHSVAVELDAHVQQVDDGLEIEAATTVPHRELGMSWNLLATISPRSELSVRAHLVRSAERADRAA